MGQNDSKGETREGWHQKFGKVEFLTPTNSPTILIANLSVYMQGQHYQEWQSTLTDLRNNPHINGLLILPLRTEWQRCLVCTSSQRKHTVRLLFEPFRKSLQEEIKNRRETGQHFPEGEMWQLLYGLIKTAAFFQREGSFLGNLHTNNVFMGDGRVRVFTVFSSPVEVENAEKIKMSKYEDAFIAPEEIASILSQEITSEVDMNRVDLFCIGLVLLSAALLKDCYALYNRTYFSINLAKLQAYKQELEERASGPLRSFINHFLAFSPAQRKLPSHYYALFSPFQSQIIQGLPFNPESLLILNESPQVINYIGRSPHSRQTRYLSLTKNHESQPQASKHSKDTQPSIQRHLDPLPPPSKVQRRLFAE